MRPWDLRLVVSPYTAPTHACAPSAPRARRGFCQLRRAGESSQRRLRLKARGAGGSIVFSFPSSSLPPNLLWCYRTGSHRSRAGRHRALPSPSLPTGPEPPWSRAGRPCRAAHHPLRSHSQPGHQRTAPCCRVPDQEHSSSRSRASTPPAPVGYVSSP
jgi:hypothetical protein